MIWGLTLKPGVSCTKVLDDEVHLSLASMESRKEFGKIWPGSYSQVVMKTGEMEVLLCTLVHGSIFQQNLDLKLMPKEKITFTVYGDCIIYISGYTSCLPHTGAAYDELYHDDAIYGDDVYNEADEKNHLGDNNHDDRPSSWTPELLPKPQDSTQSGHDVKRTETADAPDVTIIIKEEETQDVIEDIYPEDDHRQPPQEHQQEQQGGAGESSLTSHMTQHCDTYQVSQDSQDEENFAVIADIDSFPEQVSIKEGKQYEETQVDYVKQVDVDVDFQSTSRQREKKHTRGSASISNANSSNAPTLPKITAVRSTKSFSWGAPDWTKKSAKSRAEHLKPSLVANGSLSVKLKESRKLNKSTRRIANASSIEASSENKEHKCSVCRKTFLHLSSLVRHERIHTGVKPYQCRICFKPFSDAGNRAKHERIHMRVKPFACMYCGRTFSAATYQRQHQRVCPFMYKS